MIYLTETTKGDKKSIYLFSVRSEEKLKQENTETNTWDDYDCFKISQENFFPAKVMDLDTQKIIITRFLNFYVGGKVPKGLRVSDLLFAVISIIPLTSDTEEFIWHENEYRDDGFLFFLTPEEKLNSDFKNIAKKANKTYIDTIEDNNSNIIESDSNKFSDYESKNDVGAPSCDEKAPKCEEQDDTSASDNNSDDNLKKTLSYVSIKWRGLKTSFVSSCEITSKQYGPVENSAFISSCNKLLIEWDESKESRIIIKWFFGIIALTLMRGIVKGKKNIINTFKSKNFLNKIRFINSYITYTTPQERCVERCCKEMMLRESHNKVMFAKIIFNSFRIDVLQRKLFISNNYGLYNVFRMCVVDHTAYCDMGIINLLKSIYGYVYSINFSIILSDLKDEEINDSMEQVRNFILKYMKKEECFTYHWARYFDSTQFEYLSCSKSYATAVLLAVFIEKLMGKSDVWRSGWVRMQQVDLDRYKQLGEQLYKQYECKTKGTLQMFFSWLSSETICDGIS
ncbi:uncharacterized protein LOC106708667 [Papilio machaon]|uniref:uncharacterized protein LOC106708667 n=1 Tax=Papilio machaon TaxID=76193 RepID=UPI001E6647C2|nr:uncharacterized protein LOC106708667 [Papilio machaon]